MKVEIIEMHPKDAFYGERKKMIGSVGEWIYPPHQSYEDGFLSGEMSMSKEINMIDNVKMNRFYFYAIKVEQHE
jgi:hypothetical protein